jgi:colanic acid/amylovoran biosynthesis protein
MGKRIIVESGSPGCHNMGDVAMMQVAVERIGEFQPSAHVEVVTSRPDLLARFCPSALPIPLEERKAWLSGRDLAIGLREKLPAPLSMAFVGFERAIWLRLPRLTDLAVQAKSRLLRREFTSPEGFRRRLKTANLLVVCGMGTLNDAFADVAIPLLDEMEAALGAGVPVIAFGQGVGPIDSRELLERARAVLPRLALISLREGCTGLPLLESLGVPKDKVLVTGDDAIEMAFKRRPAAQGDALGVSLRLADYAGTGRETANLLSAPLHAAAEKAKCSLVPIPISFDASDSDIRASETLLGNPSPALLEPVSSPEDVIRLAGGCRAVVTGTYHGGVFALAQGIPIVGLIQSPYYEQKFKGLEAQFPGGCRLLDLRKPVSSGEIQDAILGAWESAAKMRDSLLAAAAQQVELSREAYRSAFRTI